MSVWRPEMFVVLFVVVVGLIVARASFQQTQPSEYHFDAVGDVMLTIDGGVTTFRINEVGTFEVTISGDDYGAKFTIVVNSTTAGQDARAPWDVDFESLHNASIMICWIETGRTQTVML